MWGEGVGLSELWYLEHRWKVKQADFYYNYDMCITIVVTATAAAAVVQKLHFHVTLTSGNNNNNKNNISSNNTQPYPNNRGSRISAIQRAAVFMFGF